ncbi:type II CRISPR RNA-guided endonuclease Cas9, partial [Faecalimonas sp.]
MEQKYFLGLDMGTGSLGWAVTNEKYEVLRKHGKALWGVRLFESANTAEERRGFRTARRRLDRRNWRLQILQELFAEEITKVDPGFYLRMKESKYYPEDKRELNGECPELPYALFVDENFTDKEYHQQFPTIYHLRKMLMTTNDVPDIRLVYLAFHHMMKHRGHFLLHGNMNEIREFRTTFSQLIENIKNEELDFDLSVNDEIYLEIERILKDKNITKSTKKSKLWKILGANKACEKGILNLIVGGKVKLSDIFHNKELDDSERPSISFADSGYEDYIGMLEAELGEQYYIIESAKAVYDWAVLADILKDSQSISDAKVKIYEKHKKDLGYLKTLVKKHMTKEEYNQIFVKTDGKLSNYCSYVGMTKKNGEKIDLESKRCSKEEFYDFLKKTVLKRLENVEESIYLKEELEKGTFLPKQVNKDNGVIPYQIHQYELEKIIENLSDKMSILREKGEKIKQLFTFRVPYYVGPLNGEKFSWVVKRNDQKIYPWNFSEVIDIEESAEKFIRRMTNKCTYLYGEDVMPKDSLLYSKFMVLNELNNLRLNGEKISTELKQKIYKEVFCRYRKVTQKKLKKYLCIEGIASKEVEISGIDGEFKSSLTAYHDFKEKLTGVELSQQDKENIILDIVLFGDDKKLLKKRIEKKFPHLTETQKKSICSLSYKGWGRLSKKFLEEIEAPAPETGEAWNLITALWETNDNLMELLSKKYLFGEAIEAFNGKNEKTKLNYKTVEELCVSPAVKRQIWQTLRVVKEIEKVMGGKPQRVFVEMARDKQESKRTESRKKQLQDLYRACKNEERDWIAELGKYEDHQLRSDKLYLYYTQKGKCMYSGEVIPLEELWDNTKYDIDHIYPQSKTMDDSLNNRVLVKKEYNANKSDVYPIAKEIREARSSFWKSLLEGGFISKEKYDRLTRKDDFSEGELAGFIERQIVETRQGTKAVAEILKQALPETEIVYVKAKTVSQFRQSYQEDAAFIKVREMNDFHHAKDAYLNIVVGNTYFVKFTKDAAWFIRKNPGRTYSLKEM